MKNSKAFTLYIACLIILLSVINCKHDPANHLDSNNYLLNAPQDIYSKAEQAFKKAEVEDSISQFIFLPSNASGTSKLNNHEIGTPGTPTMNFLQEISSFEKNAGGPDMDFEILDNQTKKLYQIAGATNMLTYADQLSSAALARIILQQPISELDKKLPGYLKKLSSNDYRDPYLQVQLLERSKKFMSEQDYQREFQLSYQSYISELSKQSFYQADLKQKIIQVDSLSRPENLTKKDLREPHLRYVAKKDIRRDYYILNSLKKAKPFFELK